MQNPRHEGKVFASKVADEAGEYLRQLAHDIG
jgi:hypothetical protein